MFSSLCPSALNFAEILIIFWRHISWVVPECTAEFGTNCSRFRELAAILTWKNHIFALFSESILVISAKLRRDIDMGKGHLAREIDFKKP